MKRRVKFLSVLWYTILTYSIFMAIGIIATLVTSPPNQPYNWSYLTNKTHIISQGLNVLFSAVFFFFTLNYYYRNFVERKKFFDFLKVSLAAMVFAAVFFWGKKELLPATEGQPEKLAIWIFAFMMFSISQICISLLLAYLTYLRDEKKRQKVLEEQKMQLEVEKSSANLNFLKAQINPHFLHNTLNFLYAKSLPYSPELSEGILTLSDIMRYALSEGNARDGKAPLKDEIEHVWNVIKINQLRFSNKLNVEFTVNGSVETLHIIPFVLITIVENAFKHGDLKSQENPIVINLTVKGNSLKFSCRNKKKTGPKELSTGVGL
ncbi:MAG TPA: histidine kinase, partial [Chitinophagaceae bacterium]|nr:histidine kinase [Chitinophagaceae bacterium]